MATIFDTAHKRFLLVAGNFIPQVDTSVMPGSTAYQIVHVATHVDTGQKLIVVGAATPQALTQGVNRFPGATVVNNLSTLLPRNKWKLNIYPTYEDFTTDFATLIARADADATRVLADRQHRNTISTRIQTKDELLRQSVITANNTMYKK